MTQRYPFSPKSRARLRCGDFWDIPLSNGAHAVGVVVAVPVGEQDPFRGTAGSREFVAGLLDWAGPAVFRPSEKDPRALLDWGWAHVKMINRDDGHVVGNIGYELTRLRRRSHGAGSPMGIYENGTLVATVADEEARNVPVASTYGLDVIRRMAERVFLERRPLAR